jgi:hypothetical protein
MLVLLPAPSAGRLCSGIFIGDHRGAELGSPGKRSGLDGCEAFVAVRGSRGGPIAEGVQILEHAPENHPSVIPAAGALDEGESSFQALKLVAERPHG